MLGILKKEGELLGVETHLLLDICWKHSRYWVNGEVGRNDIRSVGIACCNYGGSGVWVVAQHHCQ
jgi:hypothetical protein